MTNNVINTIFQIILSQDYRFLNKWEEKSIALCNIRKVKATKYL